MLTTEQAAYKLAFQIADALIRSGAGSANTTKSLLSIFRKTDLRDVTVSVALGQVTISHQDAPDKAPSTRVFESQPGTLDIQLRTAAGEVLEPFVMGELSADEAIEQMDRVLSESRDIGHGLVLTGFTMFGVGFALILGGSWGTTVSAGAVSAVVYGVYALVQRVKAPEIFSLAAGGITAVLGATVCGAIFSITQTAVCIVAALAAWLAGIAAYGAVHDVITGWYVSASGRILEAVTSTAGLVAGVTIGIHMMRPLVGDSMDYVETLAMDDSRWALTVLGAVVVSAGFALASGGRGWKLASLGLFGGLVQLGVLGLGAVGVSSFGAILLCSVVAGVLSVSLVRTLDLASNATLMIVLLPLFPGMLVYQGVLGVLFGLPEAGDSLLEAAITAFCLCMGGMLGQYLASEILWAGRRRQFALKHPGQKFRREMTDEENFSDIMVPIFSKPFTS
ncbi:threonine/serine exporter ThrE family protein [Kocuria sp.]|uniref:threonine/serine ThrE exporter family protein n=1 Tax=Kocuria sp. TaxID=1871328 RepID=UPI0026DB4506|nr:threonine/serine exporter family protein [Kocuria sp.]MDO4919093.1 threonine/serine exporter family protein [Kocuria sp.]